MEYRRLGSSGLRVSALSFGAWVTFGDQVGDEVAFECMSEARRHGVNFFDNAEVYAEGQAEEMMGRVIKKAGWKRSDLVISTKIFWGGEGPNDKGLARKHIVEGVRASLDRLQLDYVDLVFCHRPDLHTPIEETVRAMNHILDRGWAFYWGTSEWSASQIMAAFAVATRERLVPPQMEQPQYHMFHRDRVESEYAGLCDEIGLGLTTWSPLASGLLTGKYNDGLPKGTRATLSGYEWLGPRFTDDEARRRIEKIRRLDPVARGLGGTMAQLAIAWCLKNPRVSTVITGASRPEQVRENMGAADVASRLTPQIVAQIESVLDNRPKAEFDFRSW
jgi:voltage-dependent potassium channel beta subunit